MRLLLGSLGSLESSDRDTGYGQRATGSLALQLCGGKPRAWYNIELSNQLNGSRAGKTLSLMELALNCRTGPRQTSTKFHRRLQVNPDSGGSGL